MNSKDVLKKSLLAFDGTLLSSHDREFLEGLVTKTVEFRNQQVKTSWWHRVLSRTKKAEKHESC